MIRWHLDYLSPGPDLEAQRLGQWAAGLHAFLGHDLPNQLVAARGLARLLAEAGGDRALAERLGAALGEADARARRLAEMGRLLRQPAWGDAVSVREVIDEALATVQAFGAFADVTFVVQQSEGTTRASRPLLHQVFVELLRNAATASRAGLRRVTLLAPPSVQGTTEALIEDGGPGPHGWPPGLAPPGEEAKWTGAGLGLLLVHQALMRWRGRLVGERGCKGWGVRLCIPASPGGATEAP